MAISGARCVSRHARLSSLNRCRPPDALISETEGGHAGGVKDVSSVEDNRLPHQPAHHLEIRVAKLVPLGDDNQGIRLLERPVGPIAVDDSLAVDGANDWQRLGIVNPQVGAGLQEAGRSGPGPGPRGHHRFGV